MPIKHLHHIGWQKRLDDLFPWIMLVMVGALMTLARLAARADDLTFQLPPPPANATGIKLVTVRQPLGSAVSQSITSLVAITARSFTATNLVTGTNFVNGMWTNFVGDGPAVELIRYVSLPRPPAPPIVPPPMPPVSGPVRVILP